jgi:dipeptidyl aminopeptidase/acylaminoacyl peptidase
MAASKIKNLFALVAISPVSDWQEKEQSKRTPRGLKEWQQKGFINYRKWSGEDAQLNYSLYEDSKKHLVYDVAKKIKTPTLIIHGTQDEKVPIEQSRKTAKLIPDCELKEISGGDHEFSNKNDFNEVIRLASDFLIQKARN